MRKYIAAVLACLSLCALMLPALADSSAPVAENFEFETYRGVSFGGRAAPRRVDAGAQVLRIDLFDAASSIPPSTASAAATTSAIRPSTPTATARRRRRS